MRDSKRFISKSAQRAAFLLLLPIVMFSACDSYDYLESEPAQGKLDVDLVTFLQSRPDKFSMFSEALSKAGLEDQFRSGEYTVFALPDKAFAAYFKKHKKYKSVDEMPASDLNKLLLNHAVQGKHMRSSFEHRPRKIQSVGGKELTVELRNQTGNMGIFDIIYVDGNEVQTGDLEPTNGIIHVMNDKAKPLE